MLFLHSGSAATRTAPSIIFQRATCRAPPDKEITRKPLKGKRAERSVRRILFHSLPHSRFLTKDCFPLLLTFSAIFSKGKRGTITLLLLAQTAKNIFRLVHNAELKGEPRSGESSEQRERL